MSVASLPGRMVNAFDPETAGDLPAADRDLIARRERLLGPAYRLFYERPVHPVRGEGVWLFDAAGMRFLDLYNNVASVGHCHPHVVEAIARQAARLNTHTRYLHEGVLELAEALLATFPSNLRAGEAHAMFTCTGSEANDLALRIARSHTGGRGVVVTRLAYHGVTDSTAALSPSLGGGVPVAPEARLVPPPDIYRGGPGVAERLARDIAEAFADLRGAGIRPAALLLDTLFTSDGIYPDPAPLLAPAVEAARRAGALFIADEVQPGFGRTGSHFWGFERHGVTPDIVTMGKPMGNGHPVAGLVARAEVLEGFGREARYFNTFGGNPVSVAAALAVLQVIEREGLRENAGRMGAHLLTGLRSLQEDHAIVGDVRGAGLFIGVELVRDRATREPARAETTRVVNGLRERGILVSSCGPGANILKIRPPLVLGRPEADLFLETLNSVLAGLVRPQPAPSQGALRDARGAPCVR